MPIWRSLLLGGCGLLGMLAGSCSRGPAVVASRFDSASIRASRAAVERLPVALAAFEAGRYGVAEEELSAILAALPEADHAATAAAVLGLDGAARYRRLLSGAETSLGLARLRARRYLDALEPLERATVTDPSSAKAWGNLGVGLLHARRPCEAHGPLTRALEEGAGRRTVLHLGRAAFECGDTAAARRVLAGATRPSATDDDAAARGDRLEAELLLARIALAEGELTEARTRLERLVAATPEDPLPRYVLIQVLARQGDSAAAAAQRESFARGAARMAALQGALAEAPEQVGGLHFVAQTYSDLGLDHLAEVHYRQLLARDARDRAALRGLAELERRALHGRSP